MSKILLSEPSDPIQPKLLFLCSPNPSNKAVCFLSLKQGINLLSLICCTFFTIQMLLDLIFKSIKYYIIIAKYTLYSIFNFYEYICMIKSLKQYNFEKASKGLFALNIGFVFHILTFIVGYYFNKNFYMFHTYYLKNFLGVEDVDKSIMVLSVPNIAYILYEFYVLWVGYSYTKHLSEGHDALVDGNDFERYQENLDNLPSKENESVQFGY